MGLPISFYNTQAHPQAKCLQANGCIILTEEISYYVLFVPQHDNLNSLHWDYFTVQKVQFFVVFILKNKLIEQDTKSLHFINQY